MVGNNNNNINVVGFFEYTVVANNIVNPFIIKSIIYNNVV